MWIYNSHTEECVQARLGTYSAARDSLLEVYYISKQQNLHNLSLYKITVSSYT